MSTVTKEIWIDYFKAINGRPPTIEEMSQAAAQGEFQDKGGQPEDSAPQSEPIGAQEHVAPQPEPVVQPSPQAVVEEVAPVPPVQQAQPAQPVVEPPVKPVETIREVPADAKHYSLKASILPWVPDTRVTLDKNFVTATSGWRYLYPFHFINTEGHALTDEIVSVSLGKSINALSIILMVIGVLTLIMGIGVPLLIFSGLWFYFSRKRIILVQLKSGKDLTLTVHPLEHAKANQLTADLIALIDPAKKP